MLQPGTFLFLLYVLLRFQAFHHGWPHSFHQRREWPQMGDEPVGVGDQV